MRTMVQPPSASRPRPRTYRTGKCRLPPTPAGKTEDFVVIATSERTFAVWRCVNADPVLDWIIGTDLGDAKLALLRMCARYPWKSYRPHSTSGLAAIRLWAKARAPANESKVRKPSPQARYL